MTVILDPKAPPPLTVVQPGQGQSGFLGSIGVDFKLWGADTDGAVSIVEHPFPVGALVPPHLHTLEDEYSIVTEGEIGFRSGDREVVLAAGGYITKPRGELHAMWNAGSTPARMIEVISPAGFEGFFRELAELVADGGPTPDVGRGAGSVVRPAVRRGRVAPGPDRALRTHAAARLPATRRGLRSRARAGRRPTRRRPPAGPARPARTTARPAPPPPR